MSEAQEAIIANAAYYTRLATAIAKLEYVPSAKKHQIDSIEDLEGQLATIQKEVAQLAEKTKKERKEHETLRDSTSRRFAHKLLGKQQEFEALASKEEREYVEALEREMTARDNEAAVQQLLQEGRNELTNLTEKEQQLHSVKAELAALYSRVFDGPTESFREDDRLEYELHAAEDHHDQTQATLSAETRAAEFLVRAIRYMDICQSSMQEALRYSGDEMLGRRRRANRVQRGALIAAQTNASKAQPLVKQAIRASPRVKTVSQVDMDHSLIDDLFFNNIFTNKTLQTKIKQAAAQVVLCNQQLKAEWDGARCRADAASAQTVQASRALDRCRRELDDFRKATFETYITQNQPPPNYDVLDTGINVAAPSSDVINRSSPFSSPAEETISPTTRSPTPPNPFAFDNTSSNLNTPQVPMWGSKNPYSTAIVE